MGGGPLANEYPCMRCTKKAERTFEGIETDTYKCTECDHEFRVSWLEPAKKPVWPITEEEAKQIKELWNKMHLDNPQ